MELADAILQIYGEEVYIAERTEISGGDINDAYHLRLSNGENLFIKINAYAEEDFFEAEKTGLEALCKAGAVTPSVIAYGKTKGNLSYLLLDYVRSSRPKKTYWEDLGYMLAQVHRAPVEKMTDIDDDSRFGFKVDNYIGQTRQKNIRTDSWIDFFRTSRLAAQMKLADGYFEKDDRQMCRDLLDNLDKYLAEPEFPSLVHGDLWSGNVMPDQNGRPMLIDPAVYIGHHEVDLAMTELFGGFSPEFYDAYHEIIPKESGYAGRRDLYNLYHLLNHLNLFGRSYLAAVRRILKRYSQK
ncbi:Fructosamine-3-kinase [Selenomonas ruminantium]|uniref:Fructosamine-3-kinase n=1 Tax=Selenomonas ruminantium TaxID=971 RepID=A0A1M6X5R0_SELRU|nr:fructosamine kinase family protein [Selenomonas ruminantium]SHL01254.1 Fructosamine-3-kinase [Selenomonas ruminantium]